MGESLSPQRREEDHSWWILFKLVQVRKIVAKIEEKARNLCFFRSLDHAPDKSSGFAPAVAAVCLRNIYHSLLF
jgi:hypothetical protein